MNVNWNWEKKKIKKKKEQFQNDTSPSQKLGIIIINVGSARLKEENAMLALRPADPEKHACLSAALYPWLEGQLGGLSLLISQLLEELRGRPTDSQPKAKTPLSWRGTYM